MSLNLLDQLSDGDAHKTWRKVSAARIMLACLAAAILLASIATPFALDRMLFQSLGWISASLLFASFGLIAAGPALCALFLTLPHFSIIERMSVSMLGFVFWLGAVFMGYRLCPIVFWSGHIDDLLVVPIWVLGMSLPFAASRAFFGWQIWVPDFERPTQPARLTIAELLVATALIAFGVATLGFGRPAHLQIGLVGAAILAGVGCFLVPLVSLVFRVRRNVVPVFAISTILKSALFSAIALVTANHFFPTPGFWPSLRVDQWLGVYFAIGFFVFYAAVATALIAIRIRGGELLIKADFAE